MRVEDLEQATALQKEIGDIKAQINALYTKHLTPLNMDGMPRTKKAADKVAAAVIAVTELKDTLADKTLTYVQQLTDVEGAIDSLPPLERRIMRMHYIDGLSWTRISEIVNYSYQYIFVIRARAFDMLDKK